MPDGFLRHPPEHLRRGDRTVLAAGLMNAAGTTSRLISRVTARLSRSTSGGSFIPVIDGLRFVSIALVVLYHAPFHYQPGAPAAYYVVGMHGNFGVQMFFAISGFILGLPFGEQHILGARSVSLRRYFVRRLTRLEPPYLINLALWSAIKAVFLGRTLALLLPHLLASMTYTHNFFYGSPSEINFYAWSLEVEVQFYILAPLLALVFRLRRPLRLTLLVVAICVASFVPGGLSLRTQAQWFLVGFLLADIYLVSWEKKPASRLAWDAVSAIVWPLLFVCLNRTDVLASLAPPWLLLVAYVAAFRGLLVRRFLSWKPVYLIGGMCYSIYLYHGYVVESVVALQRRFAWTGHYYVDTFVGLSAIGIAVVISCGFMFALFEKPFMNPHWHVDLWNRISRRVPAASPGA
jgi:peptidoglycan/LPS O-acetylase OafA/YrhL